MGSRTQGGNQMIEVTPAANLKVGEYLKSNGLASPIRVYLNTGG